MENISAGARWRRQLLKAGAALATTVVAGCSSQLGSDGSSDGGSHTVPGPQKPVYALVQGVNQNNASRVQSAYHPDAPAPIDTANLASYSFSAVNVETAKIENQTAYVHARLRIDGPQGTKTRWYTYTERQAGGEWTLWTVRTGRRTVYVSEPWSNEPNYVKGTRLVDENGDPLGMDAIPDRDGSERVVFPEGKKTPVVKLPEAKTLLVRFPNDAYGAPTKTTWTVKGYAAYSAVCTHEGCAVTQQTDDDDLRCPCHQATFDPRKGAEVVSGPAPRALPQLPIGLTDSSKFMIATGTFEGPIGPQ